jgi:hypothetical protein
MKRNRCSSGGNDEKQKSREPEGGPGARIGHFIRSRATPLRPKPKKERPRDKDETQAADVKPDARLTAPPLEHWFRNMRAYRARQAKTLERLDRLHVGKERPEAVAPPPAVNWIPIGPSVAMQGQGATRPAVSGRIARVAVAPGGNRVYVAAANGGVWRSDDAGSTWTSTMDAFDLNPTHSPADSLACGAIAIDLADPDRVYVGTGEGDTSHFFSILLGLGVNQSYFGVGPLRSDDGGLNWQTEPVAAGSPTLAGQAFFQLAVDPNDRERVVAATTAGLYRRQFNAALNGGAGGYEWAQVRTGQWSDVVVARPSGGPTTFVAAQNGGTVFSSNDGNTWTTLGTGFPGSGVSRIVLAMQPQSASVVYAMAADTSFGGNFQGLYRYDSSDATWRQVSGSAIAASSQGKYDLALAVDPADVNTLYMGGSTESIGGQWSAEIRHGAVTASGSGAGLAYSVTATSIGGGAHADVHHLAFTPASSTHLWAATDGGLFFADNAGASASFEQRNVGLQTLTMNHMGLHPAEPAVIFSGAQDNGTLRFVGEECWLHSAAGDGGYAVVNWNDPYKVLRTYTYISVRRTTDGGQAYSSWTDVSPPAGGALFYGPLAGCPPSATAADAEIAAAGSSTVWLTTDFGTSWVSLPSGNAAKQTGDTLGSTCSAIAFASATRLYAGTVLGDVYRYDNSGGTWTRTRIDTLGGTNNLPLNGWVTDIAIDPADTSGDSIYLAFGGNGDWRHVWHWNGTQWAQRSGTAGGAADALLDIHHNAIAVDPANTAHVYVGADIGVWRSTDGGATWSVFSQGLPDAAIIDLKIHAAGRLLRATTHGRSVWERELDAAAKDGVELYLRDTWLDLGRYPTINHLDDPTSPGDTVRHYQTPNIIVDVPSSAGTYQTPSTDIDFYEFNDVIVDGSGGVATLDPATGTANNRVYVEVRNRGVLPAHNVRVMLLLADASAGLPSLPSGYTTSVQNGTNISSANWQTVGQATLQDLRVGFPRIASFILPSTMLPPPAGLAGHTHHCLLALLHSSDDAFTSTGIAVDPLSIGERKSAHKNLHIVAFTGTLPPTSGDAPGLSPPMQWAAVRLHGREGKETLSDLLLDFGDYPGHIALLLPAGVKLADRKKALAFWTPKESAAVATWARRTTAFLTKSLEHGRFHAQWTRERIAAISRAAKQPMLAWAGDGAVATLPGIVIPKGESVTVFLAIQRPRKANIGDCWEFGLSQRSASGRTAIEGGSVWRVQIVPEPDHRDPGLPFDHQVITEGRTKRKLLQVSVYDARGASRVSRDVTVSALPYRRNGGTGDVVPLRFNGKRNVFELPLTDMPQIAHGRMRLTLVVRRQKLESRRTLALSL